MAAIKEANRSKVMSAIRSKGARSTEKRLRGAMIAAKLRGWHLHPKEIVGRPDFCFPSQRLVVFVDGCFWHSCPRCGHNPRVNTGYWGPKLARNVSRDAEVTSALLQTGYLVQRFWECELEQNLSSCIEQLKKLTFEYV